MSFKDDWKNALGELNHKDGLQRILAAIWLLRVTVNSAQVDKYLAEYTSEPVRN